MSISFLAARTLIRHLLTLRPIKNAWHQHSNPDQPFATVAFVHGLFGHHEHTWKPLLDLVATDPQLPALEVVSWGWTTGALIGRNSIKAEGRRLMADIQLRIAEGRPIVLVGHSMGGLAIFDGLSSAMREGLAQMHPASNVDALVVYATPTNGTQAAGLVGWPLRILGLASKQIQELARSTYTDELVREVVNRIYRPAGAEGAANYERRIPIQAVVGSKDIVVSLTSAQSVFADPFPITVEGNHSACKSPTDRSDPRYVVLQRRLLRVFDHWFLERCSRATSGATQAEQDAARREIHYQCSPLFIWYLSKHPRLNFNTKSDQERAALVEKLEDVVIAACGNRKQVSVDVALNKAIWFVENRGS